jgi:hypothetical protein
MHQLHVSNERRVRRNLGLRPNVAFFLELVNVRTNNNHTVYKNRVSKKKDGKETFDTYKAGAASK